METIAVYILGGKKELTLTKPFSLCLWWWLFLIFLSYMSLCSVCAHVYVCIWRAEINVKCLFSVALRAYHGCLELTSGWHSHSHNRLSTHWTISLTYSFPVFNYGRYLGSAFVSVLIISSRFEIRGNSRIVELAVDFRVTPPCPTMHQSRGSCDVGGLSLLSQGHLLSVSSLVHRCSDSVVDFSLTSVKCSV